MAACGLACLLLLALAGSTLVNAQQCSQTHKVAPGETLAGIAKRYKTTAEALVEFNRLPSEYSLYVGQRLCVSQAPASLCANVSTSSSSTNTLPPDSRALDALPRLVLEATYVITPADSQEPDWVLEPELGVRAVFLIDPAPSAIQGFTTTGDLQEAAEHCANVVLWAAGPTGERVLGSVGQNEVLQALNLDNDRGSTPLPEATVAVTDLHSFESLGDARVRSLTVWLEAPTADGRSVRYPMPVSQVAHYPTTSDAAGSLVEASLVLLKQNNGLYRLGVVLGTKKDGSNIFGPPGANRALRCSSWPSRGWRYRFLRRLYGC
jgi:hypothetical protein